VDAEAAVNAVYVLWLRQLKRYARSRARIIGALGQPLLFLLGFGLGFGPIFQKAGQGSYIQFLAPGVIGMTILFTALFSGVELIWDRQFGFLKETLVAPVPRVMIMIGRTAGGATVAMFQGIILVAICLAVGFRPVRWTAWPLAFLYMGLIAVMFTALGTAIASILEDFQGFQLVMSFLVMPIFFLSGALFPLNDTVPAMKLIAAFDPLSYGVDGLRGALAGGGYHFGATTDLVVMSVITAGLVALGTYLFSKLQL
jgi:ABC-2 type transport system permease protein